MRIYIAFVGQVKETLAVDLKIAFTVRAEASAGGSVMGKSGGCAASHSEAISRLIFLSLRSGVETKAIIKYLRGIAFHSMGWHEGEKILQCADAVATTLEIDKKS